MKKYIYLLIGLIVLAGIVYVIIAPSKSGKYDTFAQCLKDKEALFYGTFWCSFCQSQKVMFGASAKLLPYVECSTPDGRNQLQVCKDANITAYPTWQFNASTTDRLVGKLSFDTLSEKTGCELPKL